MKIINEWIKSIGLKNVSEQKSMETFIFSSFKFLVNDFSSSDEISNKLCNLLNNQINNNEDVVKFIFSIDKENIHFSNKNDETENTNRLNQLNRRISLYNSNIPKVELEIKINKKSQDINIYSLNLFSDFLKKQTPIKLNKVLHEKFNRQDTSEIKFIVHDEIEAFSTSLFSFIPYHSYSKKAPSKSIQLESYNYAIEMRNKSSHFSNASEWSFLPEDFKFNQDIIHEDIKSAFAALHNIYLLAFLCNMSSVRENGVSGSLVGYTTVQIEHPFSKIANANSDNLWKLYRWVYSVNATDKLGIARQIIPLHIKDNDLFSLSSGGLTSAQSNFTLFQKDNVKNYIEVTNKLAEQVSASSSKAGEIAQNIAASMRTILLGGLSFFSSVFLLRIILKNSSIKDIFTGDMLNVSIAVLVIFVIMFLISIRESYMDENHFKNSYKSLKNIYLNVLTSEDINQILNDDKKHKQDLKFIKKKRCFYSTTFGLCILCLVITYNVVVKEDTKDTDKPPVKETIDYNVWDEIAKEYRLKDKMQKHSESDTLNTKDD